MVETHARSKRLASLSTEREAVEAKRIIPRDEEGNAQVILSAETETPCLELRDKEFKRGTYCGDGS